LVAGIVVNEGSKKNPNRGVGLFGWLCFNTVQIYRESAKNTVQVPE
jgi:hypothetical protein